jgi:hypothetical protein
MICNYALDSFVYYLISFLIISILKKIQYYYICPEISSNCLCQSSHSGLTKKAYSLTPVVFFYKTVPKSNRSRKTICSSSEYYGLFSVFNLYILLPFLEIKIFLDLGIPCYPQCLQIFPRLSSTPPSIG